jgi:hypothetical protein
LFSVSRRSLMADDGIRWNSYESYRRSERRLKTMQKGKDVNRVVEPMKKSGNIRKALNNLFTWDGFHIQVCILECYLF